MGSNHMRLNNPPHCISNRIKLHFFVSFTWTSQFYSHDWSRLLLIQIGRAHTFCQIRSSFPCSQLASYQIQRLHAGHMGLRLLFIYLVGCEHVDCEYNHIMHITHANGMSVCMCVHCSHCCFNANTWMNENSTFYYTWIRIFIDVF